MALAEPSRVLASMRPLAVCTSCARRLLDKGYAKADDGTIALGEPCEAHAAGKRPPQATSLVEAPESECTVPVALGPFTLEDFDELDDATGMLEGDEVMRAAETAAPLRDGAIVDVGPETEIAARLLVAWSTSERVADDMMIDAAVHAARALLKKTGGR